jgi:general secretion pathway protein F
LHGLPPLIRGVNSSSFADALAILVGGGVPLVCALGSAARVMTIMVLPEAAAHAIGRVREGASLSPLESSLYGL